jgi:hypothetical protein
MYTRREFTVVAMAGLSLQRVRAAGAIDSIVSGVRIGGQSYSFRDLARTPGGDASDAIVKAFVDVGLGDCEL